MKQKLFISLIVAVFSVATVALAAFPDVPGHPYEDAINYVESNGIVEGYPDGTYKPDDLINRAEFTKIIVGAVHGPNQTGDNCFPDVTDQWFASFVCTAQSMGIIEGYPDGNFKPENNVNYAEALKIVLNTYAAPVGPDYDEWYSKYVDFAAGNGLSYAAGKNPSDMVTRGEMAELIHWIDASPPGQPGATACQSDADCGPHQSCNTSNLCVNNMVQCMSDADCGQDEFCNSTGMCEKQQPSCMTDADCNAGENCGPNGFCIQSMTFFYPACGTDSDCYTGQSCVANMCEFNHPSQSCVVDADCPTTQFCLNDQCTESMIQCTKDSDCDAGASETCNTGTFSCERPCSLDAQCPAGQVCDSGMCDIIFIPECAVDSDCNPGETCDPTLFQCY